MNPYGLIFSCPKFPYKHYVIYGGQVSKRYHFLMFLVPGYHAILEKQNEQSAFKIPAKAH